MNTFTFQSFKIVNQEIKKISCFKSMPNLFIQFYI